MLPKPIPLDYSKCESDELARDIYATSLRTLYDEVGEIRPFGWYGLVIYKRIPYIIGISRKGEFFYKKYEKRQAAKKAWDHVCTKFENWWTERYGQEDGISYQQP
jgi:hypothetical protein